MTAAATAAAAIAMMDRHSSISKAREHDRDAEALKELHIRAGLVEERALWGNFPRTMRPFWIAQRARCPYCGERIELRRGRREQSTWDHVRPVSAGGRGHSERNKVIAHSPCNCSKGDRMPYACEVLFCQVTNEIVAAMREVRT